MACWIVVQRPHQSLEPGNLQEWDKLITTYNSIPQRGASAAASHELNLPPRYGCFFVF
jgi:hypothetical protein